MADFAYDVFLSHNRAQKDWTRDLARCLRDEGFDVWFDEWCLGGGESWIAGLERGIEQSEHLAFVVSPESVDAPWPNFEQLIGVLRDPDARFHQVIPLIHTPCPLPARLQIRQCLDFSETHGNHLLYEFKLAQLMADLDPSRERPTDFDLWVQEYEGERRDGIPPVRPLPPRSLMPLGPNPHFVGREDELRALETNLRAGSATAIGQVAAATGLGGIGKTQLAVEYAHRYGPRYWGGVFWLDMEDREAIPSQVARCGGPEGMALPAFEALSLEEQVARVKKECEKATPRLLIFDNVDDSKIVDEWRPVTGSCRVLITSRRTDWPSSLGLAEVRLATLPRDEAIELLCKGRPEALEDEEEAKAANAICDTLGDLPLAVALAGAYLESYKHDVSLTQYVEQLRQQPVLESAALVDFVQDPSPTDHVQSVAATFETSYGRLDPEDEADLLAMRLFHLASHFAPVSIRRDLLLASAGLDLERADEQRLSGDALGRLVRLGLVQEEADGRLLLHRLLGEFARHHPAPGQSEEEAWEGVAKTVLRFAQEENETGLPATLTGELPHLRHLAARGDKRGWGEAGDLFNELGYHLLMVGSYREALGNFERVLEIMEAAHGPGHPNVATAVNNLGLVLGDLGDLKGAQEKFERALGIDEAVHGPEHPLVAVVVNNLGMVLQDLGDLKGAREKLERALGIDEAAYGPDHPAVARGVNNLGRVLYDLGHLKGAREKFERALGIDEAAYGPDHPDVATDVNNLGSVLQDLGDLEGARANYERALAIDEAVHGPDHPAVARGVNNLGLVLQDLGDLEGERERFERALEIDEATYGPDHPAVARGVNNLGGVLRELGDLEGAREKFERALQIDEAVHGPDHPEVATHVNNLGVVLQELADLEGAREKFERALAIDEAAYGPDHPEVARDANNLGVVLQELGDLEGARESYERALEICRRVYGEEHPNTQTVLRNLEALEGE